MQEDPKYKPLCHTGPCPTTEMNQLSMSLLIALWGRLRGSEVLKATGLGKAYIEEAGMSIYDIEILCDLDNEYNKYESEKHERNKT